MSVSFKGQIRELDGLRGIAILMVLLHHFWPGGETPLGRFGDVAHLGWMGVDLFFVISGFLIGGILLDTAGTPHYFRNFYARRSLRIFPLYYLFLILVFTLIPAFQEGAGYFQKPFLQEAGSPAWYFLYAGNIREALTNQHPAYFLAPLWSLAIEEQFYVTFPWLVASLDRTNLWKLLWSLVLAAPLFRLGAFLFFPELARMPYLGTPSRVDVIAFGCLLALGFRMGWLRVSPRLAPWMIVLFLAAIAVVFAWGGMDRRTGSCKVLGYSLTAALFASVVLTTILWRDTAATAVLRWGPLTYVGKICYGTYLLHRPAEVFLIKAMQRAGLPTPEDAGWMMAAKIAAALAVASLSWWLFESRILRLKSKFQSKGHPQQALAMQTGV